MTLKDIPLRFSYTESFVRAERLRKISSMEFWSEARAPISIRSIEGASLRPAYRIQQSEGSLRTSYLVQSFEGGLWWPVTDQKAGQPPAPISVAELAEAAAKGRPALLAMLGVPAHHPVDREEYYARAAIRHVVGSNLANRWSQAVEGAERRLIVCEDRLYLEAGEPLYFVTGYGTKAGPCCLSRSPSLNSKGDLRRYHAEFGWAFGIEEYDEDVRREGNSEESNSFVTEIEPLIERYRFDAGALACSRALIDKISLHSTFRSEYAKRMLERLPFLSEPNQRDVEEADFPQLLRQIAAMPDTPGRIFANHISHAQEALRRLEKRSPTPLTIEEENVLATLA